MIQLKKLIPHLLLPLAVGGLSAVLTSDAMKSYGMFNQPALAPPAWLFPVVWTVLYILMGISTYRIAQQTHSGKKAAYVLYGAQLFFNFFWTLIFFNGQWFFVAFLWLIVLWGLIIAMIRSFGKIDRLAGRLQIPYLLWVTFAGYLNIQIYLLNP